MVQLSLVIKFCPSWQRRGGHLYRCTFCYGQIGEGRELFPNCLHSRWSSCQNGMFWGGSPCCTETHDVSEVFSMEPASTLSFKFFLPCEPYWLPVLPFGFLLSSCFYVTVFFFLLSLVPFLILASISQLWF